jgi:hypothetical protein
MEVDAKESLEAILATSTIEARSACGLFNFLVPWQGRNLNRSFGVRGCGLLALWKRPWMMFGHIGRLR